MKVKTIILTGHELRPIAVAAEVHPRTVRRVLLGLPTKPIVRARIERVLRTNGVSTGVADRVGVAAGIAK